MTAEQIGVGTLERLSGLGADGHAVLSVYLDLDPSRFPTPGAREAELSSLLSSAGAGRADVERVRDLLRTHHELMQGAQALAIFSSAATGVLESVSLPEAVEPMAVVDTVPWLEPLAGLVTSEDWGIAVVSRRAARLFRGGRSSLVEFARFEDELHRRHGVGGMAQARYQRGIEQQVAEHAAHTAAALLRAHRRRPFERVVLVAADEMWPVIEGKLHRDLEDRLVARVTLDLEHASADEIREAVAPVVEHAEREREHALLTRLEDDLGAGGPAVAGLDEVLTMLEQDRVDTLLVSGEVKLSAGVCPRCGRLFTSGGHCRIDGAPLASVDAVEHATGLAAQRRAEVVVVRYETATLRRHGAIAALLRW